MQTRHLDGREDAIVLVVRDCRVRAAEYDSGKQPRMESHDSLAAEFADSFSDFLVGRRQLRGQPGRRKEPVGGQVQPSISWCLAPQGRLRRLVATQDLDFASWKALLKTLPNRLQFRDRARKLDKLHSFTLTASNGRSSCGQNPVR